MTRTISSSTTGKRISVACQSRAHKTKQKLLKQKCSPSFINTMNLRPALLACASVWHSVHGQESTFLRGSDVDAVTTVQAESITPGNNSTKDYARSLQEGCWGDGSFCDVIEDTPGPGSCENCCNKPATFWPDRMYWACGQMPCWGTNTRCLAGTTCNSCCNGHRWVWEWFGDHCN